jgi:putative metal-binding protein
LVALSLWGPAGAATIYVDDNTCPATGSGSLASPYCHIQDAICAAVGGDLVSVFPGTYNEAIRMKPSVSVVSQGGATVTTINGSGQNCTNANWCSKNATANRCSVVTFASGHTPATVLDGFTITGGAGQAPGSPPVVGGGGIFVFSSPTIRNNIIQNNVLLQVSPTRREFDGAGIYVSVGAPVITNNVITGNRAVPPAGVSGAATYGYGGGIYSSFFSLPQVVANTIQGNQAGDPNLAFSLGAGGGVMVFSPDANTPGTVLLDRNLIADNATDTYGGGVALGSFPETIQQTIVSNNVIVGNAGFRGGGVYTYLNKAKVVNNTIVANTAELGGGLFTGSSDVTLPAILSNNAITGNHLLIAGDGGGIYKVELNTTPSIALESNDVFGNDKNQVFHDLSDSTFFTTNGNFSADPSYINAAGRDFHVNAGSPLIDTALASRAPAVDKDNLARGFNGVPPANSPMPGDNDVGAYEWRPACVPSTEVCDGVDNNCNGQIDEGFPDTDLDGLHDCVDPDDDNDGVPDAADCAPLDASAFGAPVEVANVSALAGSPTTLTYSLQAIGSGTHYEIVSGLLSRPSITRSFEEDFCVAAFTGGGSWTDPRPGPPTGNGWYYLIRSVNACGAGSYGTPLRNSPRSMSVCPSGIHDDDFDGSPSDLDCNDADPSFSPFQPEVCDNLDNNCNSQIDEGNPGGGLICGVSNVGDCRIGATQCVGGSVACVGAVFPSVEVCDGHDNNCDTQVDEGFPDTDSDGAKDCVDPDDDNDGVLDGADCAPLDATAFGVPVEVPNVSVLEGTPPQLVWQNQSLGAGTRYEIASGQISAMGILNFSAGTCLPSVASSPAQVASDPPAGGAFYYLVKSRNACGNGTLGSANRNTHPPCP